MSWGGLWNDYGACELEYHDTLLSACQQHGLVVSFNSKTDTQKVAPHILSIQISLCPTSFRPLPFGLIYDLSRIRHTKQEHIRNFPWNFPLSELNGLVQPWNLDAQERMEPTTNGLGGILHSRRACLLLQPEPLEWSALLRFWRTYTLHIIITNINSNDNDKKNNNKKQYYE